MSELELKSFEIIDKFLQLLVDEGSGSVYNIGNDFHSTESQMAYKILCDKDLISFRKGYADKNSIIDIAPNGLAILKFGGYKKYLDTLQQQADRDNYVKNLEIEKTETDLILAKKMLKEYPYTKWIARISLVIAIISLIVTLLQSLK